MQVVRWLGYGDPVLGYLTAMAAMSAVLSVYAAANRRFRPRRLHLRISSGLTLSFGLLMRFSSQPLHTWLPAILLAGVGTAVLILTTLLRGTA